VGEALLFRGQPLVEGLFHSQDLEDHSDRRQSLHSKAHFLEEDHPEKDEKKLFGRTPLLRLA
jgi:hypothetical protein